MNTLQKSVMAGTIAMLSLTVQAQKIKLVEGDLSALKGEKSISLELTFNDMRVGKFDKEADYVAEKTAAYNKKEAGNGDKWAKAWVEDRETRFRPKFVELFESTSDMKVEESAKYTMIFNTTYTEPGFNVYVTRKNAEISGEILIVETANKSKVLAKITLERAQGRTFGGYDFDTGARIGEAYELAGKSLGKFVSKG